MEPTPALEAPCPAHGSGSPALSAPELQKGWLMSWFLREAKAVPLHHRTKIPLRLFLQGSSDDMKRVMRREKNRIAAQKSRMRQTQKADSLHLESESLEKENAALKKEVKRLTEEAKYLSTVLSNHESVCTGLSHTPSDLLYGAHAPFHQHINVPAYPL
ncbi:hypothetical protein NFI96_025450 [Prochilodus magdalenae]|nr:hypothetical protein NFI96_025450 [Prochilodus magdalenae]